MKAKQCTKKEKRAVILENNKQRGWQQIEQFAMTTPGNTSKLKTKMWIYECKTFMRRANIHCNQGDFHSKLYCRNSKLRIAGVVHFGKCKSLSHTCGKVLSQASNAIIISFHILKVAT